MRTLVVFQSTSFNTSVEQDVFINPGNFGDDVAGWIAERLRGQGLQVDDDVGQEDHGWYITYTHAGELYDFIVGFRDENEWIGWVERSCGLLASLVGGRHRGIRMEALVAISQALHDPRITSVRWHDRKQFQRGQEDQGTPHPETN